MRAQRSFKTSVPRQAPVKLVIHAVGVSWAPPRVQQPESSGLDKDSPIETIFAQDDGVTPHTVILGECLRSIFRAHPVKSLRFQVVVTLLGPFCIKEYC